MPTYEFRCPQGHEFEKFFKTMSSAPSELPCPECGVVAARQLSGGGGLLFKGSGFYLTDYGKNAHRGKAPEAKSDGAKSEGAPKSDGKGESKSETKSESKSAEPKSKGPEPKAQSSEPKAAKPNKPKSE